MPCGDIWIGICFAIFMMNMIIKDPINNITTIIHNNIIQNVTNKIRGVNLALWARCVQKRWIILNTDG